MQLDPIQARLDELVRRLESQESLVRTLQARQVPLNEDTQEAAWWTTEAAEPQQQFDDAWWNGCDQWTGQGWKQGWNCWSNASWSDTKPTNNPTTVPTWNGDAKLFDHNEFDVLMYKRGSNPGDHCFLVPRLISGLTGRAREHLRMAGDLDRFAVDGGLEQFLEHLKTKNGYSAKTMIRTSMKTETSLQTTKSCLTLTMTWPLMMKNTTRHSLVIVRHEIS